MHVSVTDEASVWLPEDHNMGLGSVFMAQVYLVFRKEGKNYMIGAGKYLPLDKITSNERWVLLGFGLTLLAIIIIVAIVKIVEFTKGTPAEKQDEDAYNKA